MVSFIVILLLVSLCSPSTALWVQAKCHAVGTAHTPAMLWPNLPARTTVNIIMLFSHHTPHQWQRGKIPAYAKKMLILQQSVALMAFCCEPRSLYSAQIMTRNTDETSDTGNESSGFLSLDINTFTSHFLIYSYWYSNHLLLSVVFLCGSYVIWLAPQPTCIKAGDHHLVFSFPLSLISCINGILAFSLKHCKELTLHWNVPWGDNVLIWHCINKMNWLNGCHLEWASALCMARSLPHWFSVRSAVVAPLSRTGYCFINGWPLTESSNYKWPRLHSGVITVHLRFSFEPTVGRGLWLNFLRRPWSLWPSAKP